MPKQFACDRKGARSIAPRSYRENGQLPNATVVLFAHAPRIWAPNFGVRVVSFTSKEQKNSFGNDTTVEGLAIRVLGEVVGIVQQRTGFSGQLEKGKLERLTRPAYAVFALREGLVNAMVHRDYELAGGSVQVEIFPEEVVIRNPGQLPNGWTAANLAKRHDSLPANPDIARVFYLRDLMERLGTGTERLIEECKKLGAKTPVWRAEHGMVSLTLFAAPEPTEWASLGERQTQFLARMRMSRQYKINEYVAIARVSERQARRDLAELEKLGLVERSGKGPATYYRRVAQARPIRPNPAMAITNRLVFTGAKYPLRLLAIKCCN